MFARAILRGESIERAAFAGIIHGAALENAIVNLC